jgi:hypothetical protein
MKLTPVILSFFFTGTLSAQNTGPVLKFNTLALIDDVSFPAIQAGLETKLSEKWSWFNEAGIKYRRSLSESSDTIFTGTGGFKLKSELRHYLRNNVVPFGLYAGFNLFYTNDKHHTSVVYTRPNETIDREDIFAVRKQVYGFNFLAGAQKLWRSGLVTDFYAGVGLRYRDYVVSHLEYNPRVDSVHSGPDYNFGAERINSEAEDRDGFMANFTIGLRMGFRF